MTAPPDRVVFAGHSTVLIELDGTRLLTDPLLRGRVAHLRRQVEPVEGDVRENPAAVLISHLHHDHLDLPSLRRLGRGTPLVVPRGSAGWLRRRGFSTVTGLDAGESTQVGDLMVSAVPARHDGHRPPGHVRAAALGFLVQGSRTLYFAGDTELFDGMAGLAPQIDIALLPVAGWGPKLGPGHMDPLEAAHAAALLKPRVAIPIHWGTFLPIGIAARHRAALEEPPRLFAEHLASLAPAVDVRILAPGEQMEI